MNAEEIPTGTPATTLRDVVMARRNGDSDEGFDLRILVGVLRRRKILIAGVIGFITLIAALYVNQITPLYMAETLVVVEGQRSNVVDIEAVAQGISTDYYTNETQAAIIESRELAGKVVDSLDLTRHPLFDPRRPREPGLIKGVVNSLRSWVKGVFTGPAPSAEEAPDIATADEMDQAALDSGWTEKEVREHVIDYFLGGLSVVPEERSRVISIRYSSKDPKFAALASNTVAEVYILDQLMRKSETTRQATSWLDERVNELRERVIESERRLEEFRRSSGIIEIGGASSYQQELAELNAQLIRARVERSESVARYDQVQKLLGSEGGIETAAAVLDSPLIQRLREQESQVVRKIAELRTQFKEGHPKLALALNELKDLRTNISTEVEKIARNLENELNLAKLREENLQQEVAGLQEQVREQNEAEVTLRALESEVRANDQLYETMLARLKETRIQDDSLQQADARIISESVVPGSPYYPRTRLMIVAAIGVATVIALFAAFIAEFLDSGFRSLAQVEAMTDVPGLGVLPLVPTDKSAGKNYYELAIDRPNSVFGESVRSIRTGLMLSNVDEALRSVLFTSAVPGEGKTTTALAFAAAAAKSGQKVIIVDCDLRQPMVHNQLNIPNQHGLSDYLSGQVELRDVIEMEPKSGLHIIPAGTFTPNPPDLLGSMNMRSLHMRLIEQYDLVVFDTPPLMAVSDALVLVRLVNRTVMVIRWARTAREVAISALRQIGEAGGRLAGVVLSQVNMRRQAQYDTAEGARYQGHYQKYYIE